MQKVLFVRFFKYNFAFNIINAKIKYYGFNFLYVCFLLISFFIIKIIINNVIKKVNKYIIKANIKPLNRLYKSFKAQNRKD